ncbi:ROK family protein [Mycetocola sp.]|jgi:glucokinase|uniref:ROK family protein n=1 Tax=Mycetocola sp. TaxID=1871042 RepID=UPI002619F23E|nr:ROK family protein [Mycetocola sp.]MCU1559406.1 sugar kinase [Mycetocola sp.]
MTVGQILGNGPAVLAFDVGGTDTKAGLFDDRGSLVEVVRVPTPYSTDGSGDAVLAQLGVLTERFAARHPDVAPLAAGLIVPGLVDDDAGVGVYAENLGWRDVPFRDAASSALGLPVAFTHDVRAAGTAEYRLGAAGRFRNVMVVVIGTGIAGALFLDGKPYSASGFAGEIGHSVVDVGGVPCACGGNGCLEAIASAGAIARLYNRHASVPVAGAREVLELARSGNAAAASVWDTATDALGLALSQAVALLAPEAIVLGGGLAQAGDALFTPVEERMNSLLTFHRRPVLLPATVGENAGLVGAALGARQRLTEVKA